MFTRLLPTAFLLIIALGCSRDQSVLAPEPSDEITASEYSVLGAIVDSVIIGPSSQKFIVSDSTSCGIFSYNVDSTLTDLLQRIGQRISALRAETILDFKAKNLTRACIANPADIDPRCVRPSGTTAAFPLVSVSRVGFSADGQQALAYAGCVYAPLAGYGAYYVLSRQDGKWKIIAGEMVWIS